MRSALAPPRLDCFLRSSRRSQVEIDGHPLVVPTIEEMLRIKCWSAVTRNQTRDSLDIAALSDRFGTAGAASVVAGIDPSYDAVKQVPRRW